MCSCDLPVLLEAIDILTCVSLMQPLTQAPSLFSSLVVGKKTRAAAGHVAPKIWEPPHPLKNAVRAERQEV